MCSVARQVLSITHSLTNLRTTIIPYDRNTSNHPVQPQRSFPSFYLTTIIFSHEDNASVTHSGAVRHHQPLVTRCRNQTSQPNISKPTLGKHWLLSQSTPSKSRQSTRPRNYIVKGNLWRMAMAETSNPSGECLNAGWTAVTDIYVERSP